MLGFNEVRFDGIREGQVIYPVIANEEAQQSPQEDKADLEAPNGGQDIFALARRVANGAYSRRRLRRSSSII